jgi:hypothetical protein
MEEKLIAQEVIIKFLEEKDSLDYVNLKNDAEYAGWVSNFNIILPNGQDMCLNLKKENDLFLLFVLAVAWSRTGPWENAAYFVTYLKLKNKDNADYWLNRDNIELETTNRFKNSSELVNELDTVSRKKISFRKDLFESIFILATNWEEIKNQLEISSKKEDYISFMRYLRDIEGLGANSNRMYIKIPLILRELRCQNIYDNIPGELCCVPDARVIDTCENLNINLSSMNKRDIKSLIKVSSNIYDLFGDLYDLPLFAYEDLK